MSADTFSTKEGFRPLYALAIVILVIAACLAVSRGIAARSERSVGAFTGGIRLPLCRVDGVVKVCDGQQAQGAFSVMYDLEEYAWGPAAEDWNAKPTLLYLKQFEVSAFLTGSSLTPAEMDLLMDAARARVESGTDPNLKTAFLIGNEGGSRRDWRATLVNAWKEQWFMWLATFAVVIAAVVRLTVLTNGALGARRLLCGQCPRCKYDMHRASTRQCPECGVCW